MFSNANVFKLGNAWTMVHQKTFYTIIKRKNLALKGSHALNHFKSVEADLHIHVEKHTLNISTMSELGISSDSV